MPVSGLIFHLEATCGPFLNRVRLSLGPGIAILLAQIVHTLISSWTYPHSGLLQAYWALYHDLFGPGEILGPRLVTDMAYTLWWHTCVGVRHIVTGLQICNGRLVQVTVNMRACTAHSVLLLPETSALGGHASCCNPLRIYI